MKMLKVSKETHKLIKVNAASHGITIQEYVKYLVEKDLI